MNKLIYSFRYKHVYEVNRKVVLFESHGGEQYGSNIRVIYEEMLKDERCKDFTFVWAFIDSSNYKWLQNNPRTLVIKSKTKKYYRYYASAKYILVDMKLKFPITLKKEQIYISVEPENVDDNIGKEIIEKNVLDHIESKTITLQMLLERVGLFLFNEITLSDYSDGNLREHQLMAIEALRKLKDICDKHQISFYLLAGSALGAVRHKGLIPWDDDIDVGFLYEDWHKIRNILSQELKGSKFVYIDDAINDSFPRFFGKILYDGRNCVDIFLIAKWTSNSVSARIHWKIRQVAFELYTVNWKKIFKPYQSTKYRVKYYFKHVVFKSIYYILRIFFDKTDYIKLARWNEKYFEKKETDWYINLYSCYKMEKEKIKAEWIDQPSVVEFEGGIYQTLGDTDAYLRHLYGNYMKLPPQNKRVVKHSEKFLL